MNEAIENCELSVDYPELHDEYMIIFEAETLKLKETNYDDFINLVLGVQEEHSTIEGRLPNVDVDTFERYVHLNWLLGALLQ